MTPPRVSCIVPVCNGERFLGAAIDSILSQTRPPFEVIVVDDGSTDGTARVARAYGARVTYVAQANAGAAGARNTGIGRARGDVVAFLDADDLWLPQKLARQAARFEARDDLDLSVTGFQNFWMPEVAADEERFRGHRLAEPFVGYVVPTLVARRDAFDRFGVFDPVLRYSPGAPWFVQALARGAVLDIMPEVLMRRRLHAANLSRTEVEGSMDGFLHFIKGKLDLDRRHAKGS
jgi:glycosyltransferase involved in cell wall biosynthesis